MGHFYTAIKLLLGLCLLTACAGQPAQPDPIRVLLVTGGGWHDYQAQEPLLTEGLSARVPEIEWTVVHEGNQQADHRVTIFEKEGWAADYDLIVHNTGFGLLTDGDFVERLVQQHKGTPAVLIHSAVHSYRRAKPSAEPWFRFSGVQSMWHEEERTFTVENVAPSDAIMKSFPLRWETPVTEELYVVEKFWGHITPLAQAYGVETEAFHPVVWKHDVNGTRVFATTLGHNVGMFEQDVYLDLLANGVRWAVNR